MSGFFDSKEIEIPCENCGRKNKKTIGWIKTNKEFTCSCGTKILLNTDQMKSGIKKAEKSLDGLMKNLKKLGK